MDSRVDNFYSYVPQTNASHLALDLLSKRLELVHLQLLRRPADA